MINTEMNKDKPSNKSQRLESSTQKTTHELTGLQPSSDAQNPSFNAELWLKKPGSISARNWQRTDHQINESHEDNVEEEEDEQNDEVTSIQNKDYRVNVNPQSSVLDSLGTYSQNDQGLKTFSQMDKYNIGLAPVGFQKKPKKRKRRKNAKSTEGLSASNDPSQNRNAKNQFQNASVVPQSKGFIQWGLDNRRIGENRTTKQQR
ncbi:MAG: hypothetical protein EZS28_025774 [Streblomastix strix]|uniref:Uncharacterized protein n=1 Tax=Streblomastix strix TaxID=222440 RepID=A0A5J4V882_9EUKA|nr:MAG: hypothetical protein EZS28_025774 [Streblomastix strix]